MLSSALQKRPIGPETRSWQLIAAICGVEFLITESSQIANGLEKVMTHKWEKLTECHKDITATVESSEFIAICVCMRLLDEFKKSMDARMKEDDEHGLSEEFEEIYEEAMRGGRYFLPKVERGINSMHGQVEVLGIKVARQALITEYFKPLDA